MKKKDTNYRKIILGIDNLYKNDFNLQKTIAQTKKIRHNNKSLEIRKNKLKELVAEINNEYQLNRDPSKKILHDDNINFHNEYELFNKTTHKKETKIIFKDLVKLYNSKGYRIPNFSIDDHNLFKINALIETNTDMICNGFLEQQIRKKRNAGSDKIIKYLKKLGFILSAKTSNDANLQKMLTKKFKMPKFKVFINDEDTVKDLKEKIEILNNLINAIELEELEKRNRKYREDSRKNSFSYNNYNKKASLFKREKYYNSKIESNNKNYKLSNRNSREIDYFLERKKSKNSSNSNTSSLVSNNNFHMKKFNKEKSSKNLKLFNYTSYAGEKGNTFPQTSKNINIPVLNFNKDYEKKNSDSNILTFHEIRKNFNKSIIDLKKNVSNKHNNTFNVCKNNNILPYKSSINNNKYLQLNFESIQKSHNLKNPFFIKTQSNNDSISNNYNDISDELALDSKSQKSPTDPNKNNSSLKDTERKKNDSINYPYTSRNEFLNFAYNKFSKRNSRNVEQYIKSYLHKVKGYDKEHIGTVVNDIYDKNIKNNIKELEKQINNNDLYYKTERLYLNSHLIQRIKPLLNSMRKRNKIINRLEKNLMNSVSNK